MNTKIQFLKKTKGLLLRTVLVGILSLSVGMAGVGNIMSVAAEGLAQADRSLAHLPLLTPSNDNFPGTTIDSLPFEDLNVDVSGATTAGNDPAPIEGVGDCDTNQGDFSVWYYYNPGDQDANVYFDTIGSDYDTVLAIWTGSSEENLNLVACNDDVSLYEIQSRVSLFAQANTPYYIEIVEHDEPAPSPAAQAKTLDFHASKVTLQLNPSTLDFGDKLYRNWTDIKTVTVTNVDANPIQLGTLSVTDDDPSKVLYYIKNNTCDNVTLDPGNYCTFGVAFRPVYITPTTGQVTIPGNAPDFPHYIDLKGNGIRGEALIANFSLEIDGNNDHLPDSWSFANLTNGLDVMTAQYSRHNNYSMKLVGENPREIKTVSQTINKSGVAGDDFTFLVWSKALNVPDKGIRFYVTWYNGSTVIEEKRVIWEAGTYDFQQHVKFLTTPAPYTHIVVEISYTQTFGTTWFDLVTVRWAPSPD